MGRRRTISRKLAKTQHGKTTKPKRSNAPTAARQRSPSVADLQEKLDARTRQLNEAIERENATAEVLRVISSSPGEPDPVFRAILGEANFGILYQCDGTVFQPVALQDAVPAYGDYLRREPPRADPRHGLGRMLLGGHDTLFHSLPRHGAASTGRNGCP